MLLDGGACTAFELMMRRGDNPYQPEAQGLDCVRIAIGFGSRKVVEYMRKNGIS